MRTLIYCLIYKTPIETLILHSPSWIYKNGPHKMKMKMIDQRRRKNLQHLMKMMHHLVLNGMEKITVVHMILCLQFYPVYGYQSPRSGKKYSRIPTNIFLHCMMDFKNIWVVCVLLKPHVTLFVHFCMIMTLFFSHQGTEVEVSLHWLHRCSILYSKYHNCTSNVLIATIP